MKKLLAAFVLFQIFFNIAASAQTFYLEERWPALRFYQPVGMFPSPDNSKRIFVIEQNGRIKAFKDSGIVTLADTSSFLDLSAVVQLGSETGLLGMAFHPNFTQNGYVFVNYTRKSPLTTIISRFKVMANNPQKLDPNSEKIILQQVQPYTNHNSGSILFGDDGFLYIALGDGGSGGDPGNRAQNRTVLLGKILRVDVDVPVDDSTYQIPPDNPFVGNTNGWKKEIYCLGLRNPWQMTKDPNSPTIWTGDVGQNKYEEVDTLVKGGNYGWKVMEGDSSYSDCGSCDTSNYQKPIIVYNRTQGYSITGGYVYRGTELPNQSGAYFYGDYGSRKIWKLQKNSSGVYVNSLIQTASNPLSSFGLDNEKEIYVLGYATAGRIYKIRCGPTTPVLTAPITNVCIGDTIKLIAPQTTGVTGYLWSTGDTSRRISIYNTGTYQISVKTQNSFGCLSYASNILKLSVNPIPQKPVVPDLTGCQNGPNTVSLAGNLIYTWSTNAVSSSISIPQSGNYWVYAKDSVGCKSDTAFFNAIIHPSPPTPILTLLQGDTLKTDSIPGATYKWLFNGSFLQTTTTPRLIPAENGSYSVYLVNSFDCPSDTSSAIIFTAVKPKISELVILSPNPFKDKVELKWENVELNQAIEVEIFDLRGALVKKFQTRSTSKKLKFGIDLADLPKGTYNFRIGNGSKFLTRRLIKD